MSTSVEQVSRLLALVPYLQAHPDADLAETAAAFGVTPRRLLADLEVLWFVGLPGGLPGDLIDIDMDAVQSHGRIRLTNAEYLSRPMRFTIDEVTSLIVALRAVREVAGGEAGDAVDSALAKLSTVAGAQESRRVEFAVATSEGGVRDRLAAASRSRHGGLQLRHGCIQIAQGNGRGETAADRGDTAGLQGCR